MKACDWLVCPYCHITTTYLTEKNGILASTLADRRSHFNFVVDKPLIRDDEQFNVLTVAYLDMKGIYLHINDDENRTYVKFIESPCV